MKHFLTCLFAISMFLTASSQDLPYTSDTFDISSTDTLRKLKNEFSFHILPVYQIFSGTGANNNVLFQYKRKLQNRDAAFSAAIYFQESAREYNNNPEAPSADTLNLFRTNQTVSFVGGMLGYEGFTLLNESWKLYYGMGALFLYGREVKQKYQSLYLIDSINPITNTTIFKPDTSFDSEGIDEYRANILRPGISFYGGMEYQFNRNFGLSLMAMNNIYYDISRRTFPSAKRLDNAFTFDLLRIFLMIKVYF